MHQKSDKEQTVRRVERGKTAAGAAAASSHTGALSGADMIFDAM